MDYERHYLTPLFEPQSIALIGVSESEGSIGATLAQNLLDGEFAGRLFFVNPKHRTLYGQPCHARVEDIPQRLDLAVICTPAPSVPAIIDACGSVGVRCAVVHSGGFQETGPRGAAQMLAMQEAARRHQLRLLGPDCFGVMRPAARLNATHSRHNAIAGSVGLISQSGALASALLDWAQPNNLGFSAVIAMGHSLDIDFGDALDYLVSDAKTRSIFLYLENIRNARRFMSALRAAARCKPVLLLKTGRHPAGYRAALSHTGASCGTDDVFEAALRRAGVVRLQTVGQMFATAQALTAHFHPRGNRLAIITNGGGLGVMAADHAADIGVPLAEFSTLTSVTQSALAALLPHGRLVGHPLDLGDDADPAQYAAALRLLQEDAAVDGVLAILAPQVASDPTQTARALIEQARDADKPVVACWMGERQVAEARRLFAGAGIPSFRTPEPAVELFSHLSHYFRNQRLLLQTPASHDPATANGEAAPPARVASARLMIEIALQEGRATLDEMASKALLAAFNIPIAQTMVARTLAEALVLAEEIGLPVAMKVASAQIDAKRACGGVRLNLDSLAAVRDAYQAILVEVAAQRPDAHIDGVAIEPMIVRPGSRELCLKIEQDALFGPAIVIEDPTSGLPRSVTLPPLNQVLARDMLQNAPLFTCLHKLGQFEAAARNQLEGVLLRISEMICELPWLRTLEINPLLISPHEAIVLDARIVIAALPLNAGPFDHMAIHPYPSALTARFQARDGRSAELRPIRPEDAELEQAFVRQLSPQARHFRFMSTLHELTPAQLARMTQIDYDREMALIALSPAHPDQTQPPRQVGAARYAINPDGISCEFAIAVADDWQGSGLARRLMELLIDAARRHGKLKTMTGEILAENQRMLDFVSRLGFTLNNHPEDAGIRRAVLALS
jgi:acetyltransferase